MAPTSFESLKNINGYQASTFREAAEKLGLLSGDFVIEQSSLNEAVLFQMPSSLRKLFAVLLIFCDLSNPRELWIKYKSHMCQDLLRTGLHTLDQAESLVLQLIADTLQKLPIIRHGKKEDFIEVSLVKSSSIWPHIQRLTLVQNMHAQGDPAFAEYLLRIGNGTESMVVQNKIKVPSHFLIQNPSNRSPLDVLFQCVYPDLSCFVNDPYSLMERAILTTKNEFVDEIHFRFLVRLNATSVTMNQLIPSIYIAKIIYTHCVQQDCLLITCLLRNLNPCEGLCNGTRLICDTFGDHIISCIIAVGEYKGKHVLIPRIPLQPSKDENCPIQFKRTQFPLKICFAMTINKSQGQTLDFVGIYLREPVLSHGQLYVAMSRAKTVSSLKMVICADDSEFKLTNLTENVVYQEIMNMEDLVLIPDVTPNSQSWKCKVIVVKKQNIRESKSTPGKKYKPIILQDDAGNKVQAMSYDNEIDVVDERLKLYSTYIICDASVKIARDLTNLPDPNYWNLWNITRKTMIQDLIVDDEIDMGLPLQPHITPFSQFYEYMSSGQLINVLALVIYKLLRQFIVTRTGQEKVNEFVIINEESKHVVLTLWENFVMSQGIEIDLQLRQGKFPIIIGQGLRVNAFQGISLGTRYDSSIEVNPLGQHAKLLNE